MNHSPSFFIFTDDIMEQLEFRSILSNYSLDFPTKFDSEYFKEQHDYSILIVNLHLWNNNPYDIIMHWKESINSHQTILLAYTSEKHDHPSIHKAKSAGAELILDKNQLLELLQSIIVGFSH